MLINVLGPLCLEILKCFKKNGLLEQAVGVLFPFFYLPWLAFISKDPYFDPSKLKPVKKSAIREWVDAIIFAVIAASIIRIFLIEAYTIPTSSMEKTLLVGDYLLSVNSVRPKGAQYPYRLPLCPSYLTSDRKYPVLRRMDQTALLPLPRIC